MFSRNYTYVSTGKIDDENIRKGDYRNATGWNGLLPPPAPDWHNAREWCSRCGLIKSYSIDFRTLAERYDYIWNGRVLRLSLPPKNGCEQPIPSDPDTIHQSRSHRWRTMMDSGLILDSQAAMGSAKVVLHHREPTHPAVIPARLGKRQGLSQG